MGQQVRQGLGLGTGRSGSWEGALSASPRENRGASSLTRLRLF